MLKLILICLIITTSLAKNYNAEVIKANELFAQKIYRSLIKNSNDNILVSPYSASSLVALVQNAANGETAEEIKSVLKFPNDLNVVKNGIETINSAFRDQQSITIKTANKIYIKKGFSIKPTFRTLAMEVFNTEIEGINFVQNVDAAKTINKWVEDNTNNKIHDLVKSNDLNSRTRAVLLNALYFQANWSLPFTEELNKISTFTKSSSKSVQVAFMHHYEERFKYLECPHLQAQYLELPFDGNASMTFVLPEKVGLENLENNLDMVFNPMNLLKRTFLNVAIPKFKIEKDIDLKAVLLDLGVRKLFDDNEADLSKLAGVKGDLVISKGQQKTFIDVSENGVEAAAASHFIAIKTLSASFEVPKIFKADRPFMYYIKVDGVVIFVGRVIDPSMN